MNGYIVFYRGKRDEIYADTPYGAQKAYAAKHGIKKTYEISVTLAEKDGQTVEHSTSELA